MASDLQTFLIQSGSIPINQLNLHHMFMHVLSRELDFQRHMSWSFFLCSMSFIDIGEIIDYY